MFVFIFTILGFSQTLEASYSTTIATEPTVLYYWPMAEITESKLKATVGGTDINLTGATVGVPGKIGGTAVSFNGTSNSGVTAQTIDLSNHSKVVVEAMLYFNNYNGNGSLAWELSNGIGSFTDSFYLASNNSSTQGMAPALKGNVNYAYGNYTPPSLAAWHHVVAIYNMGLPTNEVDLYIDGVL